MSASGWNASLVGQEGSAARLQTPALLLDLDGFEANVAAMVRITTTSGCRLRPHVKGPKSTRVAAALRDAGAEGLACATVFEAETMAAAGFDDLLLTTPILQEPAMRRMIDLAGRKAVTLVVDQQASAEALSRHAVAAGFEIPVLIDIDVGQNRTGVRSDAELLELARAIRDLPALRFAGVQAYYGHLQGIAEHATRHARATEQIDRLRGYRAALASASMAPAIVTGGGTGTAVTDAAGGVFTELQPGSFPFIDAAYEKADLTGHGRPLFRPALLVASTVISSSSGDRVTIDAGMKAIPTDGPSPSVLLAGLRYEFAGDEFGFLIAAESNAVLPALGARVAIVPPHCDTAMNLHRWLHVVRGDQLVDMWEIEARGEW